MVEATGRNRLARAVKLYDLTARPVRPLAVPDPHPPSTPRLTRTPRADWPGWISGAIIAAGTCAVYGRTLAVPLLLDDNKSIAENLSIRQFRPLWPVLMPKGDFIEGRPLINLSYALNYASGGTAVHGYHLVNLAIHVLAGLTLFALVRRTLQRPGMAERFGSAATPLALAVSAIWTWHPVVTESVTYISQRAESLMGLFYLLTLYGFVRYAETDAAGTPRTDEERGLETASTPFSFQVSSFRLPFAILSVGACFLGMATKEVMVTAPIIVFLYDRTFVSGSFAAAWRRHRGVWLALAATWIPLAYLILGLNDRGGGKLGQGALWWAYGVTECRVIVEYLLLALWPHPLVFDYGPFVPPHLGELWPYVLVLGLLLAATIVALRRAPKVGFAACWFFLILAPVSSIVPVVGQPMAENRLYLPLAGVVALVVLGAFALAGRWSLLAFAVIAAGLGAASFARNLDYLSEQSIWSDTLTKRPDNARAHNNLGVVLTRLPGRRDDAIAQFETALRLNPNFAEAHNGLANLLEEMPGRLDDAVVQLQEAVRLEPGYAEAHNNLGNAYLKMPGRLNDAIDQYGQALRLNPDFAEAHNNLGNAYLKVPGRLDDAIAQYEEAIRLKPDYPQAHHNLGAAWLKVPGRSDDAVAEFQDELRLRPDDAGARYNLGNALLGMPGRLDDAIAEFEEAIRLKPDFADARNNLGEALSRVPGRLDDAIAQYREALRLKPDFAEAHANLGNAFLATPGRLGEAVAQYEEAVRLEPGLAGTHNNLGEALLRTPGRLDDAITQYREALRLQPDYAEARYNLGNAYLKMPGRLDDAIALYREALRLKPDYAEAHYNLAVALLKQPGGLAEAETHFETYARLRPDNGAVRDILAKLRASTP